MSRQQTKQQGAVALITAMIVSILLMITTAGMVSLTVKSLRQSTDGAQSTKAYYAAEGGLEEALLKLRKGENVDSCDGGGTDGAKSAPDGVVTCVQVTQKTNQVTGSLQANESVQIDLSEVAGIYAIKIEWGLEAASYNPGSIPNYVQNGFPDNRPTVKWPSTAPAVLEAGVIEYPKGRDFTVSEVGYFESITAPMSARAGDPTSLLQPDSFYKYTDLPGHGKSYVAKCTDAAPYQCETAPADLKTDKAYVLQLKARYNGAKYKITALGGALLKNLDIPGSMYTIDVTARAGDVFRRAQTSFSRAPESIKGLDYVLYSDTEICKNYKIQGTTAIGDTCQAPR